MQERFGIIVLSSIRNHLKIIILKPHVYIVTDLTSYASLLFIHKETGWEKLSVKREKIKLSLCYNIVSGQSPDDLQDLVPITVSQTRDFPGQTNHYNLRNSRNLTIPP
jgi:hypothetical protein